MHFSFQGIVLERIVYSDSSSIVKFLSKDLGIQSVLVKGLKGKRGNSVRPWLNKMNLVEVEAFRRHEGQLAMLKQLRGIRSVDLDVRRASVALFANEVLCRTVQEGHEDESVFLLVNELLECLATSDHFADLHLVFLMQLTKAFGALPEPPPQTDTFDLLEGVPCTTAPAHGHYVDGRMCELFLKCLNSSLRPNVQLDVSNTERRLLLEKVLEYYRLQLDERLELHSHEVLNTVLN